MPVCNAFGVAALPCAAPRRRTTFHLCDSHDRLHNVTQRADTRQKFKLSGSRSVLRCSPEVNFEDLVPHIDADKRAFQEEAGAVFSDDGVALRFEGESHDESRAEEALASGAAVVDLSHWGRLRVSGKDRLQFLHGQSTNDFLSLRPGQGCMTVFVTAQGRTSWLKRLKTNRRLCKALKYGCWRSQVFVTAQARTLDLATCYVQGSGVLVVVSPGMQQQLLQRLDKYILYGDEVQLSDVTERTCQFVLAGPEAGMLLQELQAGEIVGKPDGDHLLLKLGSGPVVIAAGTGLARPGYTFIADETVAGELYAALVNKGAVPMGEEGWQRARVAAGRPAAGSELTEDYNPLEAGLYAAVSVSKGCYIGQETISKVSNLDAVKQQLWGLRLGGPCSPGAHVLAADRVLDGSWTGLGYVRCRSKGAQIDLQGTRVLVEGAAAEVVPIPFAQRCFPDQEAVRDERVAGSSEQSAEMAARAEAARKKKAEEEATEEAARQQRLAAMQARLAAWQAQQAAAAGQPKDTASAPGRPPS